jgi:membrane protease YdiL (CAAX protease family)
LQARLLPLLVWVACLPLTQGATQWAAQGASPLWPIAAHGAQMLVCAALLWRWRKLFPELSARFHFAALPAAALVLALWLALGWLCRGTFETSWDALRHGAPLPATDHPLARLLEAHPAGGQALLLLRLLNMTLVVPCVEELFFRSAVPQALPSSGAFWGNLTRLPGLERLAPKTRASAGAGWPWTGILISSLLFAANHRPADAAAAFLTGLIWCGLVFGLRRGRKLDLGPALWSHGLANAGLVAWCAWRGDWAFL